MDWAAAREISNGLGDIGNGLEAIAKAIEKAAEKQGKPITYNIVVTGTDPDDIAERIRVGIDKANGKG